MQSIAQEKITLSTSQVRELAEIVSGFLNRKKATMKELDHKSLRKIGQRQLSRLQQVIDHEKYTSMPDVQHFLGYTEEISFPGFAPTTLKNALREVCREWNKKSVSNGGEWIYTEAILLSALDLTEAILVPALDLHVPSIVRLGKGDSNQLFFAFTGNVDALRQKGQDRPKATLADFRKWSKAQVEVVSFDPPPAPVPALIIPEMSAKEAQAKAKETQEQLQALKEVSLQIDTMLTLPTIAPTNGAVAS